jgi:hypothetical protein
MSKKTVFFPSQALRGQNEGRRLHAVAAAGDDPAANAEDWVKQSSVPSARGPALVLLSEDPSWVELVSLVIVLPYLATWYWLLRTSQQWMQPAIRPAP